MLQNITVGRTWVLMVH